MDKSSELFIDNTLEDLFFKKGFTLTSDEASKLLDITERYLCDLLKDCFDYVIAPKGSKDFLAVKNLYKLQKGEHPIFEQYELHELASKSRRKMFISREDFRNYMINDLYYYEEETDEEGKSCEVLRPLPSSWIDKILNKEAILFSQKTLKQLNGFDYNMQTYRFIKKNPQFIRVQLMTISDEKPVVRFLVFMD